MITRVKNVFKDMGNGFSHAHEEGFRREPLKKQRGRKNSPPASTDNEEDSCELHMMSYLERAQASG